MWTAMVVACSALGLFFGVGMIIFDGYQCYMEARREYDQYQGLQRKRDQLKRDWIIARREGAVGIIVTLLSIALFVTIWM